MDTMGHSISKSAPNVMEYNYVVKILHKSILFTMIITLNKTKKLDIFQHMLYLMFWIQSNTKKLNQYAKVVGVKALCVHQRDAQDDDYIDSDVTDSADFDCCKSTYKNISMLYTNFFTFYDECVAVKRYKTYYRQKNRNEMKVHRYFPELTPKNTHNTRLYFLKKLN